MIDTDDYNMMPYKDYTEMDNILYEGGCIVGYNYGCDELKYTIFDHIELYRVLKDMSIYECGIGLDEINSLIESGYLMRVHIPFIESNLGEHQ